MRREIPPFENNWNIVNEFPQTQDAQLNFSGTNDSVSFEPNSSGPSIPSWPVPNQNAAEITQEEDSRDESDEYQHTKSNLDQTSSEGLFHPPYPQFRANNEMSVVLLNNNGPSQAVQSFTFPVERQGSHSQITRKRLKGADGNSISLPYDDETYPSPIKQLGNNSVLTFPSSISSVIHDPFRQIFCPAGDTSQVTGYLQSTPAIDERSIPVLSKGEKTYDFPYTGLSNHQTEEPPGRPSLESSPPGVGPRK